MFRFKLFFVLTFVLFLADDFGTSLPVIKNALVKRDYQLFRTVSDLEKKVQDLTERVNGGKVSCVDKQTALDEGSDKPIVFLDRQNVKCPDSYLLASFHLVRNSAKVRYNYRCCKFVL